MPKVADSVLFACPPITRDSEYNEIYPFDPYEKFEMEGVVKKVSDDEILLGSNYFLNMYLNQIVQFFIIACHSPGSIKK